MPNGGTGVCGNCLNNLLQCSTMPYVGFCRVHRVAIPSPYWSTCSSLLRWQVPRQEWEKRVLAVWQRYPNPEDWQRLLDDTATYLDQELMEFTFLTAPLPSLLAGGTLADGVIYSTDDHQPIPNLPTVDELAADPELMRYVDAIRLAADQAEMSSDAAVASEAIVALSGQGSDEGVMLAANEARWLTWQQAPLPLVRKAYSAVLAAMETDGLFRRLNQTFNRTLRTLYQGWKELPAEYADQLPPIPDFWELLADERLRAEYESTFAPDRLPWADSPASEEERQLNFLRNARLVAIYCRGVLKRLVPTLPGGDDGP